MHENLEINKNQIDESDLKDIRAARPTNLARMASAFIFIILYSFYDYNIVLYFAILQFSLSLIWFWLIEKKFPLYKAYPNLWYIPASIDIFFATASVYITGVSYSPVIVAYILITCMSSVDLIHARGLFTTLGSSASFIFILVLTKLEVIPFINILGSSSSGITFFSMITAAVLLIMACLTANSVIYQIYFQLNEKNSALSTSLEKINLLKSQQDADYALTARLMEPFGGNFVKSKYFQIEFHLKQKKSFTYKSHNLEIGGDILIADELYFNESKYILFINGDAMGKSMQGACGALVLGVIFKSIITNSQIKSKNINPGQWLGSAVGEIQRIFESFDGSMLASVFIGLIEEKSGGLYHINTEHPEAILYRDEQASFLKETMEYRKIGTHGKEQDYIQIQFTQLVLGDVLFIGSDGKDDIILNSNEDGTRTINQDEFLFQKIVQKMKGNLPEIVNELRVHGEYSDDLSIMKISYLSEA